MANTNPKLFFGGTPTDLEVKRIRDQWPDSQLKEGQVITYDEMAAVIGSPKNSNRFRTVTARWKKMVEHDSQMEILIGVQYGVGFTVLNDSQKLGVSVAKIKTAVKAVRRSFLVAGHVDAKKLTDDEKQRLYALQGRQAKLLAAAQVRGGGNGNDKPS